MRTSTRRADPYSGLGPVTAEPFFCDAGAGRLLRAGDLPLEVDLPGAPAEAEAAAAAAPPGKSRWATALERYFAGEPVVFDLDVDAYAAAHGLTAFERDVYAALARVPYGTVVSYRELAAAAGRPHAYRAAGSVMARNLLPVILPCHRVIRNDGRLGRYGDDPAWKGRLLALEGVRVEEGRVA